MGNLGVESCYKRGITAADIWIRKLNFNMHRSVSTKYTIAMSVTGNISTLLSVGKELSDGSSFPLPWFPSFLKFLQVVSCQKTTVSYGIMLSFKAKIDKYAVLGLLILFNTLGAELTLGLPFLCANSTYCAWTIGSCTGTTKHQTEGVQSPRQSCVALASQLMHPQCCNDTVMLWHHNAS